MLRRDAQLAEQRLGSGIFFQVDPPVRQAVAGGELAQAARVRREARPDDPHAHAEPDQDRPPDEVGLQDQAAEHRVLRHQLPQPLSGDDQHLPGLGHGDGVGHDLAAEQAELAEETPGAVHADYTLIRRAVSFDDCGHAAENQVEVACPASLGDQDLACGGIAEPPSAARTAICASLSLGNPP